MKEKLNGQTHYGHLIQFRKTIKMKKRMKSYLKSKMKGLSLRSF